FLSVPQTTDPLDASDCSTDPSGEHAASSRETLGAAFLCPVAGHASFHNPALAPAPALVRGRWAGEEATGMISVESVTKRFGALTAVDGVSFEVQRGQVVGFLGPNGAGKTTTMRMLAGTLQPDAGAVRLDGRPISEDPTAARKRIGYMPESNALYTEMLVSEYLDFAAELRGLRGADRRSALRDAIEQTGIGDVYYRPIGQLSKGYRQRVGLAAAILHRPEVLIL